MTPPRAVVARAHAKINLSLRVLGRRTDGYHELRTVFQSIDLHDTLTCLAQDGPFRLLCRTAAVPLDAGNLVCQAAERLWRRGGRKGEPANASVFLDKRIPVGAGLGGGSSDAAAALVALSELWDVRLDVGELAAIGAEIGADVPFFLEGGTALGSGRGDRIHLLPDHPARRVVLLVPGFGISTREAYGWYSKDRGGSAIVQEGLRDAADGPRSGTHELVNDLESAVIRRYPEVADAKAALAQAGAEEAAMSGSGSAVFGLFASGRRALAAARRVERPGWQVIVTRTLRRREYRARARPRVLAAKRAIE